MKQELTNLLFGEELTMIKQLGLLSLFEQHYRISCDRQAPSLDRVNSRITLLEALERRVMSERSHHQTLCDELDTRFKQCQLIRAELDKIIENKIRHPTNKKLREQLLVQEGYLYARYESSWSGVETLMTAVDTSEQFAQHCFYFNEKIGEQHQKEVKEGLLK